MDLSPDSPRAAQLSSKPDAPWFHRLSRPILFLIISLALVGGYFAFTIPVAVFPNTDFPRIVIGVDNGVMPIDQMLVTITRPIEEAVNSVPGLQKVTSVTSRGSAEVDLYFDWKSDMILTLQRVDAVVARLQPDLPSTAKVETHRLTFAVFPVIGYSLTSDALPPNKLPPPRRCEFPERRTFERLLCSSSSDVPPLQRSTCNPCDFSPASWGSTHCRPFRPGP